MFRPRLLARWLLGATLYYSGAFHCLLRYRARRSAVCVLGLHRILDDQQKSRCHSQDAIVLGEESFEEALDFLARHFDFISLTDFLRAKGQDAHGNRPRCVLTFDDGWRDNYAVAYPTLKRKGVPATIFLATRMITGQTTFWVEQLRAACGDSTTLAVLCKKVAPALKKNPSQVTLDDAVELVKRMPTEARQNFLDQFLPTLDSRFDGDQMLTWEQVREMSCDAIEFGSHTETHPLLTFEKDDTIEHELCSSRQNIEAMVNAKVRAFAYPNGDWNERVREWVRQTGYEWAFTTRSGWYRPGQDTYTAPRILLHDGNVTGASGRFSPAIFSLTLMGWL
jgi:peptidoglycan/xylan/chitin deacetylase (PgdA/CDA1 family)